MLEEQEEEEESEAGSRGKGGKLLCSDPTVAFTNCSHAGEEVMVLRWVWTEGVGLDGAVGEKQRKTINQEREERRSPWRPSPACPLTSV